MTKERMKDLLIVGMLPFLVVACETTDWSFLEQFGECFEARQCDIIHENAPPELKCDTFESRDRP
jgi:hypothetical protein